MYMSHQAMQANATPHAAQSTSSAVSPQPVVHMIGSDTSLARSLSDMLPSVGMSLRACATPEEFLDSASFDAPGCVVLDVRLPGMSGLELQERLTQHKDCLPFVFVTAFGDIPMSVRAMRAGAVDFLAKPFREQDLIEAVLRAVDLDIRNRKGRRKLDALRNRFARLNDHERRVMVMAASGKLNKQIADSLNRSPVTIKLYRKMVMQKMEVRTFADLVTSYRLLCAGNETGE